MESSGRPVSSVRTDDRSPPTVASIGKIASPAQVLTYYERDGYYVRNDPAHREESAWAGKGAEVLGLTGPVDPEPSVLEGKVPDGPNRVCEDDPSLRLHAYVLSVTSPEKDR